jgi:hypothetical protein
MTFRKSLLRCYSVLRGHLHWQEVPLSHSKEHLRPNELQITHKEDSSGQGVSFCVSISFPAEQDAFPGRFKMPEWGEFRIAWTIIPPASANNMPWKSIDHYSMLPYGWIPNDGIDFFIQFILYLKERWLKLCDLGEKHLNESVS